MATAGCDTTCNSQGYIVVVCCSKYVWGIYCMCVRVCVCVYTGTHNMQSTICCSEQYLSLNEAACFVPKQEIDQPSLVGPIHLTFQVQISLVENKGWDSTSHPSKPSIFSSISACKTEWHSLLPCSVVGVLPIPPKSSSFFFFFFFAGWMQKFLHRASTD